MRTIDFQPGFPGELHQFTAQSGEMAIAFSPDDLPAKISLDPAVASLAESAAYALGELNGMGRNLPNATLLARLFARKEALASSRIEGTRAEYAQLVMFEADESAVEPDDDYREVANLLRVLTMAWEPQSLIPPLTLNGIASMHLELLRGVRGERAHPGEYRHSYVMIGRPGDTFASASFVPAPPYLVRTKLQNLLHYLENRSDVLPFLVQLAISHYQFEVIHPFLDGNGRIGRVLIPLILKSWGRLDEPLLYVSEYLERHRDTYVDLLDGVSKRGAWTEWVLFFLESILAQSNDALVRGQRVLDLRDTLRAVYQGTRQARILPLIDELFMLPSLTFGKAQVVTGLTAPASNALVKRLIDDGVLVEMTGRSRNQVFFAPEIARISMGIEADGDRWYADSDDRENRA